MTTTGLLALSMAGVTLTTSLAWASTGRRFHYDETTRMLHLDGGLTLDEVCFICEELVETVVNRLLAVPSLQEQDPAG